MVAPPQILKPTQTSIVRVSNHLSRGGVAVVPTETVYGLAGVYENTRAENLIYKIKKRPRGNPLICHVDGVEMASCFSRVDGRVVSLAVDFWPGPLTMILHSKDYKKTIAVRSPRHPVARELLKKLKKPFVAPSANLSGYISPTKATHVYGDFLNNTQTNGLLILDGGDCECGVESTIVDLTKTVPTIIRPGVIKESCLKKSLGSTQTRVFFNQINAPGTSPKHYSPVLPTILVEKIPTNINNNKVAVVGVRVNACYSVEWPPTPKETEKMLYSALREADKSGAEKIFIVHPPSGVGWSAVWDRLFRATAA